MRLVPTAPLVFLVASTPLVASFAAIPGNQAEFDAAHLTRKADFDRLGHARDNEVARLYWFTDLSAAKAQAKRENKPILSLRMLGKLTDEYSCANSRFFRVALYPNAQISRILREKYVLHWSTERPVPVVTIDFGDGRQIKRTITGNSAHYLLDSNGQPLDVLPSLYAPGAFARWLEEGVQLAKEVAAKPASERTTFLSDYHRQEIESAVKLYEVVDKPEATPQEALFPDEGKPGLIAFNYMPLALNASEIIKLNPLEGEAAPSAELAEGITLSKARIEMPILNATRLYSLPPLRSLAEDAMWTRLGEKHRDEAKLDENSRRLFETKLAPSAKAGLQNQGQQLLVNARQSPTSAREKFEATMAKETAFNELRLHLPIHALFVDGKQGDFQSLNRKIYDRLFLTPKSDAWMGLRDDDAFNALENGGVITR